jgi:dihydroflavonol-4-reductase
MKALVTGAAGFIGSHVVRELASEGISVRALSLPGENRKNLDGVGAEIVTGDVRDRECLRNAMQGVDWVFHLAAIYALWLPDPSLMHDVNVEGTRNVLAMAREAGVKRVIHTSSIARFGGQGKGVRATEKSAFRLGTTGDVYSQSKYAAHEVARAFAEGGLDVTIVAPTGPIGPGDIGPTPTGRLLRALVRLPSVVVLDTESNFADVRDMAKGHLLAARVGKRGESYLLGGEDYSLRDLAKKALRTLGIVRPVLTVPFASADAAAYAALAYTGRVSRRAPPITPASVRIARLGLSADCTKAREELGLRMRPIEESLRDAFAYWRMVT